MGDARMPGGTSPPSPQTPMIVLGDLNLVGGPGPENTLTTGDIFDNVTFGPDVKGTVWNKHERHRPDAAIHSPSMPTPGPAEPPIRRRDLIDSFTPTMQSALGYSSYSIR
ncbi:MAG: hypothetical protein R3E58_06670 [Phycisphaerae bacterium]